MAEFLGNRASFHLVEQPKPQYRFLHKPELSRSYFKLQGVNLNNSGNKTSPTVEIKNCFGRIIVRCSIYQADAGGKDFLPHSNELILKIENEEYYDPHHIVVGAENGYRAEFKDMAITITKIKDIIPALVRKKSQLKKEYIARLEGFTRELSIQELEEIHDSAALESKIINRDVVCLRFDAFTEENGILYPVCEPLFSEPIFEANLNRRIFSSFSKMISNDTGLAFLKSRYQELITDTADKNDLNIYMLSCVTSRAKGKQCVDLLVKLNMEDADKIKVRFYELDVGGKLVWEDWGTDVHVLHNGIKISLKTPKYRVQNIADPVNVFIELVRPMNFASCNAKSFRYIPNMIKKNCIVQERKMIHSPLITGSSSIESTLIVATRNLHLEQIIESDRTDLWGLQNGFDENFPIATDNLNSDEFKEMYSKYQQKFESYFKNLDLNTTQPSVQISWRSNITWRNRYDTTVTADDKLMAVAVLEELLSFIRTIHTSQQAVQILNRLLRMDYVKNALQIFIYLNDNKSAIFLIKMIAFYRTFDLLEKGHSNKETALHTAIICRNKPIISSLLLCGAKISSVDYNLNTSLHVAALVNSRIDILEMLLKDDNEHEKLSDFIDVENSDSDTSLTILINKEKENLEEVKLLCQKNTNINKIHAKNGFVPIRLAIEKNNVDMFEFFLSLENINPYIEDFTGTSPLTAALSSSCREIRSIAQNYMDEVNKKIEAELEVFYYDEHFHTAMLKYDISNF